MNVTTAAILGYVVLQLGVAFAVARSIRSEDDYLLAGRSLGLGMGTLTVFATWFGAETCVGASARAYEGGLAHTTADPFGYTLCLLLLGAAFAVPLYRRRLTTLADLFRQRWGPGVERLAALVLVPSSVLWAAAQIRAFGLVLGSTSSIPVDAMIVFAGAVVIIYTASGGLLADAVTDLVQGGVLIVSVVLLGVMVATAGGPGLGAITPDQLALFSAERSPLATLEGWAVPIFGSVVAQELVARVLASRDERTARRAVFSAAGLYLAIGIIPPVIGLAALHQLPAGSDGEQVLALMARAHLPEVLYVVFAGALVSAILSTVDSALLAAGALLGHNVILPLLPGASERTRLRIARLAVVGFGVAACGLALAADSVYALVETASSIGTSGVLWLVVFALYGERLGGRLAATAALVGGVGTYALANLALALPYPFVTSLVAALALYLAGAAVERAAPALR